MEFDRNDYSGEQQIVDTLTKRGKFVPTDQFDTSSTISDKTPRSCCSTPTRSSNPRCGATPPFAQAGSGCRGADSTNWSALPSSAATGERKKGSSPRNGSGARASPLVRTISRRTRWSPAGSRSMLRRRMPTSSIFQRAVRPIRRTRQNSTGASTRRRLLPSGFSPSIPRVPRHRRCLRVARANPREAGREASVRRLSGSRLRRSHERPSSALRSMDRTREPGRRCPMAKWTHRRAPCGCALSLRSVGFWSGGNRLVRQGFRGRFGGWRGSAAAEGPAKAKLPRAARLSLRTKGHGPPPSPPLIALPKFQKPRFLADRSN